MLWHGYTTLCQMGISLLILIVHCYESISSTMCFQKTVDAIECIPIHFLLMVPIVTRFIGISKFFTTSYILCAFITLIFKKYYVFIDLRINSLKSKI